MSGGSFGYLYAKEIEDLLNNSDLIENLECMRKALLDLGSADSAIRTINQILGRIAAIKSEIKKGDELLGTLYCVLRAIEMWHSNDGSKETAIEALADYESESSSDEEADVTLVPKNGFCYFIHCQTGCTCCSDENVWQGPYFSEEEVLETAVSLERMKYRASQYAENGRYSIRKTPYELLSGDLDDGKIIIPLAYSDDKLIISTDFPTDRREDSFEPEGERIL